MLGKLFDKILEEKEEIEEETGEKTEKKEEGKKLGWLGLLSALLIFVFALAPRLYYLFFVSGTQNTGAGWYGDTYHHWQIAYLSKEVGFKKEFLRLWDLKGLEYYWGLLHPLLLSILFTIFRTVDIVVPRLLSIFCGSISILLIFLLGRRYWNWQVGATAAILAAFNPVVIFNDASGILEPLGLVLLLAGVWFWPKKPFLTGFFWALASWARAEAWLFGIGMIVFVSLTSEKPDKKVIMAASYFLLMLFYLKYLLDKTGNAIYPLWWNYLALAIGKWQAPVFSQEQFAVKPIFTTIFLVFLVFLGLLVWKKPKGFLLLSLGAGATAFIGGFMGLTAYLSSYTSWFWMVRFFVFPYIFLGLLFCLFLFWLIPKRVKIVDFLKLNWLAWVVVLILIQPLWQPIWQKFEKTYKTWEIKKAWAKEIAKEYRGGTILIPEYEMDFTYALVRFWGISGRNLQGQMYTIFAYKPFIEYSHPFVNWERDRNLVFDWLERENIKLIMVDQQREPFKELLAREPEKFRLIKLLPQSHYQVLEVQ